MSRHTNIGHEERRHVVDTDLLWVCEKIMMVTHKFHCSNEFKGEIKAQGRYEKTGESSEGSEETQGYGKARSYSTKK